MKRSFTVALEKYITPVRKTLARILLDWFRDYVRQLHWTLDLLGVSESLWRKIGVAIGIQYGGVLALAVLPALYDGATRTAITVVLLAGTTLAVFNTIILIYYDIISPIRELNHRGEAIANGNLSVERIRTRQEDELGSYVETANEMLETLRLLESQATAITNLNFDKDVFDEPAVGRMGEVVEDMRVILQDHIRTIEEDRERYSLINHLLTHDVANEINVIEGYASQIETDSEDAAEMAETIRAAATNVEEIIEMARTLDEDSSAVSVNATRILEEEVEDVSATHPDAEISGPATDEAVYVRGNILLHAVFRNLVMNAIEHNSADTPVVETAIRAEGGRAVVEVSDNGPGIDSPESVFEDATPGSGLDLVSRIVERFDGSAEASADAESGTTFRVELPLV
ncbi:MAG: ATP-binding protein [Halanaeroarchaeum sp.]